MKDVILQIENISKSFYRSIKNNYGEDDIEEKILLSNVNLSIEKGKITALIGGNGTGKTTLFNIISGLLDADKGKIIYNNLKSHDLTGLAPHKIARLGVGRMYQDNHIFPDLSVIDNMLIADDSRYGEQPIISLLRPKKLKELEINRKAEVKELFNNFLGADNEFWKKRDHPASKLSYGQQRLLGLFRLFMAKYDLLLLDEPTSGVNPGYIATIGEIIRSLVKSNCVTVFFIEHNMLFVKENADISAYLNKGKVQKFGITKEVLNDEDVKRSYLGIV